MMAKPDPIAALRDALDGGDDDAICAALQDMLIFKAAYPPTPADLGVAAAALGRGGRVEETALQVLHAVAMRQGTLPGDAGAAAVRLRGIADRLKDDPEGRAAYTGAVHLLACLDDPAAIEYLAYDARRFDGVTAKPEDYCHPLMVEFLRRHDAELADLQAVADGEPAARRIGAIREYARDPAAYEERMRLTQDDEVEIL